MIRPRSSFVVAALLVLSGWVAPAGARPVPFRNYDQAAKEADVVVIASAVATRETKERLMLPGIAPPLPAIGVETTFEVAALLKGKLRDNAAGEGKERFVLHHYRLEKAEDGLPNGPGLVRFDPTAPTQYLMFLKRDSEGRYEALTGQTDPDLSIESLRWHR